MALSAQEGIRKLEKLLYSGRPKISAPPAKPEPQTAVKKHSIIGIATEAELRDRARLAAEEQRHVEKKTARKGHAKNYKGPKIVICPCGVPFEVPRRYGKDAVKYHSAECRAKYRVRKYVFTPEMDEAIRAAYRNQVGMTRGQVCTPLAEKLGLPRWRVSKRALALGLVSAVAPRQYPKTKSWTDAEKEIVGKYAAATLSHIGLKLGEAGFHRSQNAIKIYINRTLGPKPKENYSSRALARLLGIDDHAVTRWIHEGWLKASKAGTARTSLQGGDMYVVRPIDVREFVIEHVALIYFRKLDKFWLVELLTSEGPKKQ